jgi:hypothetical protein
VIFEAIIDFTLCKKLNKKKINKIFEQIIFDSRDQV